MNELVIFKRSIKDYFTRPMLGLLIYPLLGSLIVLYLIVFNIAGEGMEYLNNTHIQIEQHQSLVQNGNIEETTISQSYTGNGILDFLLQYTITSWVVGFFLYAGGFLLAGYFSIFLSLLIVGLLTPRILSILRDRHYQDINIDGYGTIVGAIFGMMKRLFIMFLLFILLIPLYFVPFINIVAINLPLFYFFHKTLQYDVSSELIEKDKFGQLYYLNKTSFRMKSLFLYVVSLIPFVSFFISIFYIIYIGNSYFGILVNKRG
ncbi:MAG: EI24 domain-containing protein [Arcobacteraceae bacterium]|nr:EI24 domain-containing protein [Arcobacteraceae bacterium]